MARVKLHSSIAGLGYYGEVVEVSDEEAKTLIEAERAELAEDDDDKAPKRRPRNRRSTTPAPDGPADDQPDEGTKPDGG